MNFKEMCQLHNHSKYSMLDAVPSPEEWVAWSLENGCRGFAITDHGTAVSMYDAIRFPEYIRKYNKKHNTNHPDDAVVGIPSVELYVKMAKEDRSHHHITAWAYTNEGYRNLIKLASLAYNDKVSYYGNVKARVTFDLIEQYKEGIKFGTGCIAGPIGNAFWHDDAALAEERYLMYQRMFGEHLYVEFHPTDVTHNFDNKTGGFTPIPPSECACDGNKQKAYNIFLKDMVEKHGGKPIPVTDAHFIAPEDKCIQDVLLMNGNVNGWYFYECYSQKKSQQVYDQLKTHLGDWLTEDMFAEWIDNTYEVMEAAKAIEFPRDKDGKPVFEYHLPKIDIPKHIKKRAPRNYNKQTYLYLVEKCMEHGRWNNDPVYIDRFQEEIDVIMKNKALNFIPYFLLYEDICSYARSQGILQNIGRGSAGGCLISYYLKIIHIDPIEADLPFPRFLSHARIAAKSFPDIDCDFGNRDPIITYLKKKYKLGFAQVCTFQKMKVKSAIKDAMWSIYGKNRNDPDVKAICKTIPDSPQGLDEADFLYGYTDSEEVYHPGLIETNKKLIAFFRQYDQIESMVKRLLGIVRQFGRHASAFVISTVDLSHDCVPTMMMVDEHSGDQINVTQFEASMVEATGLVKADILSVDTIDTVSRCVELVKQRHGEDYLAEDEKGVALVYRLPEDEGVYADFYNKQTDSSFQFNTSLIKNYIQRFCPTERNHLSDLTALCRPGALSAPFVNNEIKESDGVSAAEYYMDVRNGKRPLSYLHPDLASCTTNGVFCIAEDSMISTIDGLVKIQDVVVGQDVLTEDGSFKAVLAKHNNGEREVIKIRLSQGEELLCTPDHKVLTDKGWVEAQELTSHHLVKSFWVSEERSDIGDDRDWLVGMLLADGNLCSSSYNVACRNEEEANKIVELAVEEFSIEDGFSEFRNTCWYAELRQVNRPNGFFSANYKSNKIKVLCKSLGIHKKSCKQKFLPKNYTLMTLAGFFDGDGCDQNGLIRLANKQLAYGLYLAFDAYRIPVSYYEEDNGVYTVAVRDLTHLPLKFKTARTNFSVKVPRKYIKDYKGVLRKLPGNLNNHFASRVNAIPIAKTICERIIGEIRDDRHVKWSNVLSIKKHGIKRVYDLSVSDNHSFVVGGNVVHNCYQEEIMKFLVDFGGYTLEESDRIRGAIAKKKRHVMLEAFDKIRKSCGESGWTDEQIKTVCSMVDAFSRYSFNKSHSRCYAELGYITMYLKHHYPLEWWASELNVKLLKNKEEKLRFYMTLLEDTVVAPSIDKPTGLFEIDDKVIRSPVTSIKTIGGICASYLLDTGPFKDFDDYMTRIPHSKVNKAHFQAMVKARVFDVFMDPSIESYAEARLDLMQKYMDIREVKEKKRPEYFKPDMYELDPISIFLQEKELNKCFNKNLLTDDGITAILMKEWPGLKPTGRKGVPFIMNNGGNPIYVLSDIRIAERMLLDGYEKPVGMILLFEESRYRTGISKRGKPWHLVSSVLSDGFHTVESTLWDYKKALKLPANSIVYVKGILKEGWKTTVCIDILEIELIQE